MGLKLSLSGFKLGLQIGLSGLKSVLMAFLASGKLKIPEGLQSTLYTISTFWAVAAKGTKSCRTQGTFFRLSVRAFVPPQALSGLKFALSGLKPVLLGF